MANKSDKGFDETEKMLNDLEKRLHEEYEKASKEMNETTQAYFARFEEKDEKKRQEYEEGKITKQQYTTWRKNQMLTGERYKTMCETLAADLTHTDEIAMKMVSNTMPDVYALNMNYETYSIEKESKINTSFTLYNHDAVERLIKDNPQLLPTPKVDIPKDLRWNQQHINTAITQGILQGKSIPDVAKNLQRVTGMDERAAIRNARTAMGNAQNGGRYEAMQRAAKRGLGLKKGWMSTLDHVTRDSHVDLDGEVQELDKPFSNGLMYPCGIGEPAEVYNCRCRLTHEYDKYKTDWSNPENRNTEKLGNMTYEQWKDAHKEGATKIRAKTAEKKAESAKESPQKQTQHTLAQSYESHRLQNNLNEVPLEDLGEDFFKVDYKYLNEDSAQVFSDVIAKYSNEYDTTLTGVRTMTKEEVFSQHRNAFAATFYDYTMDSSTILINPMKCKKMDSLSNKFDELSKTHWSIKIESGKEGEYVATHEFAHTLINMQTKLDKKTNWVGADYGKITEVRKEIEDVYSRYLKEVQTIEGKAKAAELEFLNTFNEAKAEEARKLYDELDKVKLSTYSLTNSDEFMAESFTNSKIGTQENKYADEVMEIIDRNFKKG